MPVAGSKMYRTGPKGRLCQSFWLTPAAGITRVPAETLEKLAIVREKKGVEFLMANGLRISRSVGFAIVRVENHFTVDEVVFAEKGDLLLLGSRTLEGLNLTVDPQRKKLVAGGPVPAA
jgi:predicted aspartyl protease